MNHPNDDPRPRGRFFRRSDWIGAVVMCEDAKCPVKLHTITDAVGPFEGPNPNHNHMADRYWLVKFADGRSSRMWEDRKCVILDENETA